MLLKIDVTFEVSISIHATIMQVRIKAFTKVEFFTIVKQNFSLR